MQNSQSLNSAHLHGPDVDLLMAGCFCSGASGTSTLHTTRKDQKFEASQKSDSGCGFKRNVGGNFHVLMTGQRELHKTSSPDRRGHDS